MPEINPDFISELQIKLPEGRFETVRGKDKKKIVKEDEEQSFLADKSLVSFISEVNGQNRQDVLNSTLLAQMAANKKFPDPEQVIEWYKAFIDVLSKIGWNIEEAEISKFESSKDVIEVETAIVDILTTALGGNALAIITKTLDSIKKMSSNDHKIIAFETNTHSVSKGCFQIALAVENNKVVTMQLGTFLLSTSNKIKQILFFKSTKDKTRLEYSSRKATLNSEVYSKVREAVVKKLGEDITAFVAEIEI